MNFREFLVPALHLFCEFVAFMSSYLVGSCLRAPRVQGGVVWSGFVGEDAEEAVVIGRTEVVFVTPEF